MRNSRKNIVVTFLESCGDHPVAAGVFSLLSVLGLLLSIYSFRLDRKGFQEASRRGTELQSSIDQLHEIKVGKPHSSIPTIVEIPYEVARKRLLENGWIPQANHWRITASWGNYPGNALDLWRAGFTEVDLCSPTGYAACRFEFNDPYGNLLVVITVGEADGSDLSGVSVWRVYLNPKNETSPYVEPL